MRKKLKILKKIAAIKEELEVLYVINDKHFGELKIKRPDQQNTWWNERTKVEQFISALKFGCTKKEARIYAGVTQPQWKYFKNKHPELCPIFNEMRDIPVLQARATVVSSLRTNPDDAKWYLARKRPNEFRESSQLDLNMPNLVQNVIDINRLAKGNASEPETDGGDEGVGRP